MDNIIMHYKIIGIFNLKSRGISTLFVFFPIYEKLCKKHEQSFILTGLQGGLITPPGYPT
jgi:hypothetical protein